jgi:hypothetical protein
MNSCTAICPICGSAGVQGFQRFDCIKVGCQNYRAPVVSEDAEGLIITRADETIRRLTRKVREPDPWAYAQEYEIRFVEPVMYPGVDGWMHFADWPQEPGEPR